MVLNSNPLHLSFLEESHHFVRFNLNFLSQPLKAAGRLDIDDLKRENGGRAESKMSIRKAGRDGYSQS